MTTHHLFTALCRGERTSDLRIDDAEDAIANRRKTITIVFHRDLCAAFVLPVLSYLGDDLRLDFPRPLESKHRVCASYAGGISAENLDTRELEATKRMAGLSHHRISQSLSADLAEKGATHVIDLA
jgi:hypothetical protein